MKTVSTQTIQNINFVLLQHVNYRKKVRASYAKKLSIKVFISFLVLFLLVCLLMMFFKS